MQQLIRQTNNILFVKKQFFFLLENIFQIFIFIYIIFCTLPSTQLYPVGPKAMTIIYIHSSCNVDSIYIG